MWRFRFVSIPYRYDINQKQVLRQTGFSREVSIPYRYDINTTKEMYTDVNGNRFNSL